MKKILVPSIIVSAFLVGCGGGSSGSSKNLKEIKDIDAYIVNAKVCDGRGICAITDEKGVARADFDLNTSLTSIGGFIDSNLNGIKDADELEAPFLKAPSGASVITPLTTLIANGADINKVAKLFNITPNDILHKDPIESNDANLIKAINAIYPVIKENKITYLAKLINETISSTGKVKSDLPDFDTTSYVNPYSMIKNILSKDEDKNFIEKLQNISSSNTTTLITEIENLKIHPIINKPTQNNHTTQPNLKNSTSNANNSSASANINVNANSTNVNNTNSHTNSNTNSNNSNNNSTTNHQTITSNTTDLPTFKETQTKKIPLNESNTDLPQMNSNNIKLIPTNNEYNPSHTPLPKMYFVKLNSLNEFVEVKKESDKKYEFKKPKLINVANQTFDPNTLFNIDASYIFNDLNLTPDGTLFGTILIKLKDLNSSKEANFTVKNVVYAVNNSKLNRSNLTDVDIYLNNSIKQNNYNAGIYNQYNIDLSQVMGGYDKKDFNITNHEYSFEIDYNISNTIATLLGKYKVVKGVVPTINLTPLYQNSFIVPKNSDINLTIGTTNVANANCKVDGISLTCKVDNAKNILLQGKTPNSEEIDVVTITLDNNGFSSSKSFYLEVLKPANNQIVYNWNLNSGYEGYHIEMNLTGNLANNTIDVNTSANPTIGAPEANVTVYLFNNESDNNNYIRFTFDANEYKSNDYFIIKRGDNKKVIFRVGDVDISNNSFYFK